MARILRVFSALILAASLALAPLTSEARQSKPLKSDSIYLSSATAEVPQLRFFETLFSADDKLTYQQVRKAIDEMVNEPALDGFKNIYRSNFISTMEIEDLWVWIESNPEIFAGINDYVDDPGNGDEPLWQSTNRKLRNKEELSKEEAAFKRSLLKSMDQLPSYRGIVFRGAAMQPEWLKPYQPEKEVPELSFMSTSIDPRVALKFSKTNSADRISVIFIVKASKGAPVSIFHAFHWEEYEVLLRPNQTFKVHHALYDDTGRNAIVVMEQK